ncbi:MAG TPA: VOC family protein [Gaiellaceae bacterium]|jgi:methylmalonyl-CoA/ethylmalonyl-CoA epimerase
MREPVFTETMQVAIVVRDLDATMQRYVEDYRIGPWGPHEFSSSDVDDLREYGEPVEHTWRVAVTTIGSVMWELIEPLDDRGIDARFLAEKGEGVHHIAAAVRDFDDAIAMQTAKGKALVGSGALVGTRVAYLATDISITLVSSGAPRSTASTLPVVGP